MASRNMEFLSFDLTQKKLKLKSAPIPVPKSDEVLIKVAYSGICGTDLHILKGEFPCKNDGPLTLGHEFGGIIEAVGSSVKSLKVGQRVAVDPNSGCNTCDFCHNAKYHLCKDGGIQTTVGIFRDGGWATHAVIPETQVHPIPSDIEFPQAALTEPLSCLAHGLDLLNPINIGMRILVIGAGIIGLLWSSVLHLSGHRKSVTVSEMQERRRQMSKNLGFGYDIKQPSDIQNQTFDLIVDCSGSGPAIESGLKQLECGGKMCIFGVANPKANVAIQPFEIYKKELQIIGVNINPFTFKKGLNLVRSLGKAYLDYEKLGIKVYKLNEYETAFADLKNGTVSKAVFKL